MFCKRARGKSRPLPGPPPVFTLPVTFPPQSTASEEMNNQEIKAASAHARTRTYGKLFTTSRLTPEQMAPCTVRQQQPPLLVLTISSASMCSRVNYFYVLSCVAGTLRFALRFKSWRAARRPLGARVVTCCRCRVFAVRNPPSI